MEGSRVNLDEWDDILCPEPEQECETPIGKKDDQSADGADDEDGWGDVISIEVQEGYCSNLMKQMEAFRKQEILCDAFIVVDDLELPVHRNIVSAVSPFLKDIFARITRPEENRITLRNLNGRTMEEFLHFMYTGEVCIHDDNVRQLVATANFLQLHDLKQMGAAYLEKKLSPSNAVEILMLAQKHDCRELGLVTERMICDNFVVVAKTDGFKRSTLEVLIKIIKNEDLRVMKEEEVFEAVIEWTKADVEEREKSLPKLLHFVRLPLVSPMYLADRVESEPLIARQPSCLTYVREARDYQLPSSDRTQIQGFRTKPRNYMGVVWGIVAIAGWLDDCLPTRDVYAFVPSNGKWHPLSPVPAPRYNHSVVSCNGLIYVIGGRNEHTMIVSTVFRFDPSSNKWTQAAPLPYELAGLAAVSSDGQIYVIGGLSTNGSVNRVWKYSSRKNLWQKVAPLNYPRGCHSAVSDQRFVYAVGGVRRAGSGSEATWEYLDSMEIYDKEKDVWLFGASMPSPRAYGSASYLSRRIFVMGGQNELLALSKGIEVYHVDTREWHSAVYFGVPRSMSGVAVDGTHIYYVGGVTKEGKCTDTVETFDVAKERWSKTVSLPLPLGAVQCCSLQLRQTVLQGLTMSLSDEL